MESFPCYLISLHIYGITALIVYVIRCGMDSFSMQKNNIMQLNTIFSLSHNNSFGNTHNTAFHRNFDTVTIPSSKIISHSPVPSKFKKCIGIILDLEHNNVYVFIRWTVTSVMQYSTLRRTMGILPL